MITVKLQGGLGNQMFQYALGRCLAKKNSDELELDLTFLLDRTPRENFVFRDYCLDVFDIHPRFTFLSDVGRLAHMRRFLAQSGQLALRAKQAVGVAPKVVREESFAFHPEILQLKGNIYLDGYWQSYRYFREIEDLIRKEFALNSTSVSAHKLAERMRSTQSVCVNVRRGDYVRLAPTMASLGFVGAEYYAESMKMVLARVREPKVFVFSDEIEWCADHLRFDCPTTFVGHEYAGEKFRDYLYLMTLCKHFIIPNSSFGWWGAWLSNSGGIVVAPKRWFKANEWDARDLVPERWLRL
jgi:hypothetical protein